MDRAEFRVLRKHCFLNDKILFKQRYGLICVIHTLFRRVHRLTRGILPLNAVVQTQLMVKAVVTKNWQLFWKKMFKVHSFCSIVN